jgi:O-antigen/teichoic acid export membrane protein
MSDPQIIAKNSVKSTGWNLSANIFMTLCSFLRIYILARLVSVETYGVYGKALSFVFIAIPFLYLGHGTAMLHRAPETEDEENSATVLFTLCLITSFVWAILMVLAANLFFDLTNPTTKVAFYALIFAEAFSNTASTPRILFARKVDFKRQAIITFVQELIGIILAVVLARLGAGIWALVSANLVPSITSFVLLYFWRPIFYPRLNWQPGVVKYFFRFGSKVASESLIYNLQERIDDLWVASYLGSTAAGFYTQAHIIARYPLKIFSTPVINVASGTFNALKNDKNALGQSFETVCSFLSRLTFFIGGAIFLISQEFVVIYLGDKWLPLLNAMRIMVAYMMIEPIKEAFSKLFSAIGHPELALRARIWQLLCLVAGIVIFSWWLPWEIEGVALAVNISILVGLLIMIFLLRPHQKVSWKMIFGAPVLAVTLAAVVSVGVFSQVHFESVWISALSKLGIWSMVYWLVEFIFDRKYLADLLRIMRKYMLKKAA